MDRSKTSLSLTMFTLFFAGCTGQIMDRTSHVMDQTSDVERKSLDRTRQDWEQAELTQQYLAEIASELETIRLPVAQQVAVTRPLASLPTPSELAAFTPSGPLDGEAYESLKSAAEAHEKCLAVHADNLSNVDSTAFKRRVPVLEDSQGPGCKIAEIDRDFQQGAILDTGESLDVAIVGEGFFCVEDRVTGNTVYTRAGNLSLNANGAFTFGGARSSRFLEPNIVIPTGAKDISISSAGIVEYRLVGDTQCQHAGQIQMASFVALDGLESLGEGLYAETDASGSPMIGCPGEYGLGTLKSGMLENSNVNPIVELTASLKHMRMLKVVRWLLLADRPVQPLQVASPDTPSPNAAEGTPIDTAQAPLSQDAPEESPVDTQDAAAEVAAEDSAQTAEDN